MSTRSSTQRHGVARKRVSKACRRCRDQKIKCSGSHPCQQCGKRNQPCHFDDESQKVVVTRRYISTLHDRLASFESKSIDPVSALSVSEQLRSPEPDEDAPLAAATSQSSLPSLEARSRASLSADTPRLQDGIGTQAPLTNPLAFHTTDWVPGPKAKPVFMGTSSNWSFGRRVLTMTHERLTGMPLPVDNLLFDSEVYDLGWDGRRNFNTTGGIDYPSLPPQDFAVYLINSVKFHCGRLFYLFEEERFMDQFTLFYQDPVHHSSISPLWYVHCLLILAFGKALVVQSAKSASPPGLDLFVQAMKLMPDFTFFEADPIEETQVLCCAALYLQCVNHRSEAHRIIGNALRGALKHGMHTEMHSQYLEDEYVQRCRTVWWTVYVLERQMSSLMGVPMGIAEESISTPVPTFPGQPQRSLALKVQVKLSQILAMIDQTVYGIDGKLDSRYLGATQSVLRSIATITPQLNSSFDIHESEAMSGISRTAAHLHLLQHQCIILTTRPLLYIFLQARLQQPEVSVMHWQQSESIKGLLQICIESAQQILRILSKLLDHGLLEIFLPFDLDATFTATIAILMAAAIDSSLLHDHKGWSRRAYTILDEMSSRGNKVAKMIQSELELLENHFHELLSKDRQLLPASMDYVPNPQSEANLPSIEAPVTVYSGDPTTLRMEFGQDFGLNYELNSEQLMQLANTLDIDNLNWLFPGADDISGI